MPLHAQIACIGGNALFALLFAFAAINTWGEHDSGMAFFLALLAAAAVYTALILLKFRKYLSAETAIERELSIERMREEIDQLKANNAPEQR